MNQATLLARTFASCAMIAIAAPALAEKTTLEIRATPADAAAVSQAQNHFISAMNKASPLGGIGKLRSDIDAGNHAGLAGAGAAAAAGGAIQNPADLSYQGGVVIPFATQHAIYALPNGSVCKSPACWGHIGRFLRDLNDSPFMHVTDQYVGTTDDDRYPVAETALTAHYNLPAHPLTDANMAAIAHQAALKLGVHGYRHIFHIFLAPEQNVCFDTTYTVCSSNVFCAYHSSAVFKDIGEIVYTVEPYDVGVFGCNVPAGSPNGAFDDQYTVLSHELFETVTDPDGGSWWNTANAPLFGNEIGDECLFLNFDANGFFSSTGAQVVALGEHSYQIQTEYNNAAHACTNAP